MRLSGDEGGGWLGERVHRGEYNGGRGGRSEGDKVTKYVYTNNYQGGSGVFKQ
jgi:hypothetical protein